MNKCIRNTPKTRIPTTPNKIPKKRFTGLDLLKSTFLFNKMLFFKSLCLLAKCFQFRLDYSKNVSIGLISK